MLDRGSMPMIPSTAFGPLPLNINDRDMSPTSVPTTSSSDFTDISFTLLACEAMLCQKKFAELPGNGEDSWVHKLAFADAFEQSVLRRYQQMCDPSKPIQKLTKLGADQIMVTMNLLMRRPPYKQKNTVPAWDNFDIMEAATRVLEGHLNYTISEMSAWTWKSWPPWYAVAIVLAELCTRQTEQSFERAWVAAQAIYARYARPLNDPECGMLWKPITKLMRRVQQQRQMTHGMPAVVTGSTVNLKQSPSTMSWDSGANLQTIKGENQILAQTPSLDPAGLNIDWNAINEQLPSIAMGDWDIDMTYNDLDPMNGVSLLDWDLLLQDISSPPGFA